MTAPSTSGQVFATANSAMVRGVDSASTVHVLLADCLELLGAASAGVLLRVGEHGVDVLAATSHESDQLELYQSQVHSGPCIESIRTGSSVAVTGADALVERWPDFGRAMRDAGYVTVHAEPMHWRGSVLGGLNLFWRVEKALTASETQLVGALADICSIALMQASGDGDPVVVQERVRVALQGRVSIERAKGVLAQVEGIGMAAAFDLLVERSRERDRPLTLVAEDVLAAIVVRPEG